MQHTLSSSICWRLWISMMKSDEMKPYLSFFELLNVCDGFVWMRVSEVSSLFSIFWNWLQQSNSLGEWERDKLTLLLSCPRSSPAAQVASAGAECCYHLAGKKGGRPIWDLARMDFGWGLLVDSGYWASNPCLSSADSNSIQRFDEYSQCCFGWAPSQPRWSAPSPFSRLRRDWTHFAAPSSFPHIAAEDFIIYWISTYSASFSAGHICPGAKCSWPAAISALSTYYWSASFAASFISPVKRPREVAGSAVDFDPEPAFPWNLSILWGLWSTCTFLPWKVAKSFSRPGAYFGCHFLGPMPWHRKDLQELFCTRLSVTHSIFAVSGRKYLTSRTGSTVANFHFIVFALLLFVCPIRWFSAYLVRFGQRRMADSWFLFCWRF